MRNWLFLPYFNIFFFYWCIMNFCMISIWRVNWATLSIFQSIVDMYSLKWSCYSCYRWCTVPCHPHLAHTMKILSVAVFSDTNKGSQKISGKIDNFPYLRVRGLVPVIKSPASSFPVCIFYWSLSFVGASRGELLFQLADTRCALVMGAYL